MSIVTTPIASSGTFTPTVTLVGGAGNTVPVYTTNTGLFTRIGDLVFVRVLLDGDGGNEGAGTGQINIALPVTAGASNINDFIPAGHFHNSTTEELAYVTVAPSATTAALSIATSATQTASATGADQNSTTRSIVLSFFYRA